MPTNFEINPRKLSNTLRILEDKLRAGDFHGMEELSDGERLTAAEMENAVLGYRHKVVGLNAELVVVVPIADSDPHEWSVDVPIKDADAKDDLTLSLFLSERADRDDIYRIEVSDIHVL